jgi:hypothetical protein
MPTERLSNIFSRRRLWLLLKKDTFCWHSLLTILSAQQKPNKLHPIARKRDFQIIQTDSTKIILLMALYLLCYQGNSTGEGGLDEGLVSLTMNGIWCVMYEVRGAWYVVRSTRCKARGMRYEIRGTWYVAHLIGLSGGHRLWRKYCCTHDSLKNETSFAL